MDVVADARGEEDSNEDRCDDGGDLELADESVHSWPPMLVSAIKWDGFSKGERDDRGGALPSSREGEEVGLRV